MTAIATSVVAVSPIESIVVPVVSPVGVYATTVTALIEPRGVSTASVLP
jgi:hypothetical protein